jgi:hypothetical protein
LIIFCTALQIQEAIKNTGTSRTGRDENLSRIHGILIEYQMEVLEFAEGYIQIANGTFLCTVNALAGLALHRVG